MCRGARDELLQVDIRRAERRAGLLLRLREQRGQLRGLLHHAHAAPAAARRGFQNHRVADRFGQFQRLFGGLQHARRPRQHRHAHLAHEGARPLLHPHQPDHLRPRPDELQAGGFAHLGEAGVLAQETVARVDGVHVGDFGRADDGRRCPGSCARSWPGRCRWPGRQSARASCSGRPPNRPPRSGCPVPCRR